MAAVHHGRTSCPECGFGAAHVRQNEGKHPYRYCPECGANYATRNARQAADLMAKTRQEGQGASATPPAPAPAPATPEPIPTPKQKAATGFFSGLLP